MKKYYIPYELSQRMVKLGFSEKCFDIHGDTPSGKITNNLLYNGRTLKIIRDQVFDWFREKHNLTIVQDLTSYGKYFFNIKNVKTFEEIYYDPIECYDTFNQMIEEAIEKLIEIVENEKTE